MSDVPSDRRMGLTRFRRYTWWTLAGHSGFFMVVFVGAWVLDPDPPAGPRVAGGLALAVTVVASAALLAHRLALTSPAGAATHTGQTDHHRRARRGGQIGHVGPADLTGRTAPIGDAGPSGEVGLAGPAGQDGVAGRLPLAWLAVGAAAAAVLGGVLLAVRNYGLWWYAPATIVTIVAAFLPTTRRWVLIAGTALGAAVLSGVVALASGDGLVEAVAYPAGLTAVIAWITLGALWSWDVADRLNEARRLAAELAVKDERLRFAADLHDIQGHHLQVIALKSELAARLAGRDAARAAGEMEEVQRLATKAIQDTRAVVQGYRRTTLDDEIANATRVMAAADIDARMTIVGLADQAGGTDSVSLLGLVMREATTNVLRHSRARHAEVDYRVIGGCARLRVTNDGAVDPSGDPGGAADSRGTGGTGLRSLAERLEAAGGELTWSHEGDRFGITASLPVSASTPTPASAPTPDPAPACAPMNGEAG